MKQYKLQKKTRTRFGRNLLIGLWSAAVLVLLIVGGMAYGGFKVTYSRTNLPNLAVNGIAVGGLTEAETVRMLQNSG